MKYEEEERKSMKGTVQSLGFIMLLVLVRLAEWKHYLFFGAALPALY